MTFRVDLKIFLFAILFYFTKQIEIYAMIMFFAFLHEIGHVIAGILLGMRPQKLEIVPYGVTVSFKLVPKDYNKKIKNGNKLELKRIFVALAGPITNLIIMTFLSGIELESTSIMLMIYSNLLLILFNFLPIYPLDGGRVLKGILHILFGKIRAERYINKISFVSLIIFTFIASIVIYKIENISIFLIVIVLWVIVIKQDIIFRRKNQIYCLMEKSN